MYIMRSRSRLGWVLAVFGLVVSLSNLSLAQFSNQGIFGDLLQALPRINQTNPANPGFPMGVPASTNAFPDNNSPMASSGFGNNNWTQGTITGRPRDWSLGVAIDNTDTGCVVRQVQPNSPAQRAGIEQGDLIVAIGGSQVGLIGGRLNDVGEQIRRSADVNGNVDALVQDGRTLRLQRIPVSLESASTSLAGIVTTRDRISLPFGSILTVKLENASRQFYDVNGGQVQLAINGNGPFGFEMHYDPRFIDPRDQYRLTAFISDSRGQMIYGLAQPLPVSPGNMSSNIRLELESLRDLQARSNGSVITASYGADPNLLNQIYMQLLNRAPNAKEQIAWSQYLSQGNSINDLKAKILGSPNFYDRVGQNPQVFIQTMIQLLKNQPGSPQEVQAWLNRLQQYQGQREEVVREFLQQLR
jgi:uncharacterized lipoprotein YbaY